MDWLALKDWLVWFTSLEKDALHIYAGVAIQLVAAAWARGGLGSPWPLLLVLAAAVLNEAYDLLFEVWPDGDRTRQWVLSAHDVANTLAMPGLIWWLARSGKLGPSSLPANG